jgi:hypothetical protein
MGECNPEYQTPSCQGPDLPHGMSLREWPGSQYLFPVFQIYALTRKDRAGC